MFLRIQTSRAKLKQVLHSFKKNALTAECMIAPRPLPQEYFKFYIAFATVENNSENHLLLKTIKNHKYISETEFENEIGEIKYYWKSNG